MLPSRLRSSETPETASDAGCSMTADLQSACDQPQLVSHTNLSTPTPGSEEINDAVFAAVSAAFATLRCWLTLISLRRRHLSKTWSSSCYKDFRST